MRKSNVVKAMACFMAATMAITCVPSANVTNGVSMVAEAAKTEKLEFKFDGVTQDNKYTENKVTFSLQKRAKIVQNPDNAADATDKVLYTDNGYITTESGALKDIDFSDGFSISMKIRPDKQESDWNYLFGIGINGDEDKTNGWNYLDGTIGFIQRGGDDYEVHYPGNGWVDGNPLGGIAEGKPGASNPFDYFIKAENSQKWYNLAYVYDKNNVSIYIDGVLSLTHEVTKDWKTVLAKLNQGKLNIGCGIDTTKENCPAYYDDIKIFNKALTANEVDEITPIAIQ